MYIRERYPIRDRVKVLAVLLAVLIVLFLLAELKNSESGEKRIATIEMFLKTAMKPVGKTMYIWGGGWDEEDASAGATSTQIGISPNWEAFANLQDESYDFREYRFEREKGLDCSGYVGWVLYNTFENENDLPGYVTVSTDFAQRLAERGWGKLIKNPKEFLPGDIVSMEGHVWICLGTCKDGSVLLVHSSPPGVSVCGIAVAKNKGQEDEACQAMKLATEYMQRQRPQWQKKYPNREVPESYLEQVSVFRWNNTVMSDAKELQNLSAEEIMGILSPDM